MMKRYIVLAFMVAGFSTTAIGQGSSPFHGSWNVKWEGQSSNGDVSRTAKLVVADTGGSWQTHLTRIQKDPCNGQKVPIAITSSTSDTMVIRLKFSEVIQGCNDGTVGLKLDGTTVTGTRGKDKLVLTKQ